MPWITPDDEPGTLSCFKIWLPSGVFYEAAANGAILSLAEAENWQQVTGQDVETVADAFGEAFDDTVIFQACGGGTMEIGMLYHFGSATPPSGSLLCDGSSYLVADYPDLYAVIGYVYGGSGLNFNVPNCDERFMFSPGGITPIASSAGARVVTLQVDELPSHRHGVRGYNNINVNSGGTAGVERGGENVAWYTQNTGSDNPHENMPPYLAIPVMIKAE